MLLPGDMEFCKGETPSRAPRRPDLSDIQARIISRNQESLDMYARFTLIVVFVGSLNTGFLHLIYLNQILLSRFQVVIEEKKIFKKAMYYL